MSELKDAIIWVAAIALLLLVVSITARRGRKRSLQYTTEINNNISKCGAIADRREQFSQLQARQR